METAVAAENRFFHQSLEAEKEGQLVLDRRNEQSNLDAEISRRQHVGEDLVAEKRAVFCSSANAFHDLTKALFTRLFAIGVCIKTERAVEKLNAVAVVVRDKNDRDTGVLERIKPRTDTLIGLGYFVGRESVVDITEKESDSELEKIFG